MNLPSEKIQHVFFLFQLPRVMCKNMQGKRRNLPILIVIDFIRLVFLQTLKCQLHIYMCTWCTCIYIMYDLLALFSPIESCFNKFDVVGTLPPSHWIMLQLTWYHWYIAISPSTYWYIIWKVSLYIWFIKYLCKVIKHLYFALYACIHFFFFENTNVQYALSYIGMWNFVFVLSIKICGTCLTKLHIKIRFRLETITSKIETLFNFWSFIFCISKTAVFLMIHPIWTVSQ